MATRAWFTSEVARLEAENAALRAEVEAWRRLEAWKDAGGLGQVRNWQVTDNAVSLSGRPFGKYEEARALRHWWPNALCQGLVYAGEKDKPATVAETILAALALWERLYGERKDGAK